MSEQLQEADPLDDALGIQPRLRDRVAARLAREIVAARLGPGDPFPSSEDIIRRYGVSRTVARETVQTLSMVGMLRAQQGKRTAVLPQRDWDLLNPIVLEAFRQEGRAGEIVRHLGELRLVIEPATAEWMALRGDAEDAQELERIAHAMSRLAEAGRDRVAFLAADRAFHDCMARASGNPLVAAIRRDIGAVLAMGFALSQLTAEDMRAVAAQHREIAAAVVARDHERARTASEDHVRWAIDVDLRDIEKLEGGSAAGGPSLRD